MGVQIIHSEGGDELVVLSRRHYDALLARAGDEAAEDRMAGRLLDESGERIHRGEDVSIPEAVWDELEQPGANRLAVLRRWRGMTQAQLAATSGIAQPNISAYEREAKGWHASTLAALARALAVPMDVLEG